MIGFYRSTDNGATWPQISNVSIVGSTVLAINQSRLFMGMNDLVSYSTDDGDSWVQITKGLPQFYVVQDFNFVGSALFAGSISGLYKLQGDSAWVPTSLSAMVYSLTSSGTQLFAGTVNSGVMQSTDFGNSWNSLGSGISGDVISLAFSGTNLLAGTTGNGLWILYSATPVDLSSFNASCQDDIISLNWNTATETNNRGFEIQRKTSKIDFTTVAFANGKGTSTKPNNYNWSEKVQPGVYSYRLKQLDYNGKFEYSKSIEVTINPALFSLNQNYPNPFNPVTTIGYSIPVNGHVSLKVYDLLGKEVASLVNENKPAGSYQVEFDAGRLSSAYYIYELRSGNLVQIKKMILLK